MDEWIVRLSFSPRLPPFPPSRLSTRPSVYPSNHPPVHLPSTHPPVQAMRPFGIVPGSRRNLSVPTHVAWMGGVMGAAVDLTVRWSTDADGTMRSSAGETIVDYRPWESREQNLKRGVTPGQMKF